jgi:hypothetical protein
MRFAILYAAALGTSDTSNIDRAEWEWVLVRRYQRRVTGQLAYVSGRGRPRPD